MDECIFCHKETDNKINYNYNHGFCSGSKYMHICPECDRRKHMKIGQTLFCKIGNKLFYEHNADYGIFDCLSEVRDYDHFEYLRDLRLSDEFLNDVKF